MIDTIQAPYGYSLAFLLPDGTKETIEQPDCTTVCALVFGRSDEARAVGLAAEQMVTAFFPSLNTERSAN